MTPQLDRTVALVTGASSGIGAATAVALAAEGAAVAVVARRRDRLEELEARIGKAGGRTLVIEADVTDEQQGREAVGRTVAELGRLDILVNNAGQMLLGRIEGADTSMWRRMLDLNVAALMTLTHEALPHLLHGADTDPRHVSDIVNISSVAGRVARAGSGGYNASKWAVNAFSESLRQEVTKRHVRVALVEPGAVDTELASHNTDPEVKANLQKRFGETERLTAEDIAELITFMVTRPRRMALNEILVRPTEQVD
ncbi:MAG: SDR family NAD(P)-dependent oxidoreductase [Candidatus Dormibacteraeota bacterium]|uniref:SDR family NAD(P)-dependent oxidoreductase n=1 Tax=Candidatus Amunia macphersoniae TaxID=3127014 RepID=A0A934N9E3_9BACT|nr:SDR family NAD(P)-dependent oxidoreductase [Candidatus Dormibacteraeota bacterium]